MQGDVILLFHVLYVNCELTNGGYYFIIFYVVTQNKLSGCGSAWLERHLREVEVASSNLVTPITKETQYVRERAYLLGFFML